MSLSDAAPSANASQRSISSAERIRELSAINAEVAAMLQSAGHAINALSDRPVDSQPTDENAMADDAIDTLELKKKAFTEHTNAYYTGLQSIVARLRRQAYALEEAGIIAPESTTLSSASQQRQAGQSHGNSTALQETERISNGGFGNLDVGWLNSRGNKVGIEKEAELVEEAKRLLEDVLAKQGGG